MHLICYRSPRKNLEKVRGKRSREEIFFLPCRRHIIKQGKGKTVINWEGFVPLCFYCLSRKRVGKEEHTQMHVLPFTKHSHSGVSPKELPEIQSLMTTSHAILMQAFPLVLWDNYILHFYPVWQLTECFHIHYLIELKYSQSSRT